MEAVAPDRLGMAAGTYYTARYLGGVIGASLAGTILGARVTAQGVSTGFAVLAVVGVAVAVVSLGLPGRPAQTEPRGRDRSSPRARGHRSAGRFATVPLMSTGPAPGAAQRAGVLGVLGGNRTRLVLTSGTLLFVELLLIRWIPSEVRYIGFFSNFLLMASFLGIGIGLLLGRLRKLDSIAIFPIILVVVVALITLARARRPGQAPSTSSSSGSRRARPPT